MALVEIPRVASNAYRAGHWQLFKADELGDHPHWSAVVFCPECGRGLSLVNHSISADGTVTPSIGHPDAYRKQDGTMCGWHPNARLLDWPNDPAPQPLPYSECARCHKKSRSVGGWGSIGNFAGIVCEACFKELMVQSHARPSKG